jgi:hypothetical protein
MSMWTRTSPLPHRPQPLLRLLPRLLLRLLLLLLQQWAERLQWRLCAYWTTLTNMHLAAIASVRRHPHPHPHPRR